MPHREREGKEKEKGRKAFVKEKEKRVKLAISFCSLFFISYRWKNHPERQDCIEFGCQTYNTIFYLTFNYIFLYQSNLNEDVCDSFGYCDS